MRIISIRLQIIGQAQTWSTNLYGPFFAFSLNSWLEGWSPISRSAQSLEDGFEDGLEDDFEDGLEDGLFSNDSFD